MPLHPGLRLRGEGLFRYLSFVAGGLPDNIKLMTFIPPWLKAEFEEEMLDLPPEVRSKFVARQLSHEFSLPTKILAWLIARNKRANDPKLVLQRYKQATSAKNAKWANFVWKLKYTLKSWRFFVPFSVLFATAAVCLFAFLVWKEKYLAAGVEIIIAAIILALGVRLSLRSLVKESVFEKERQREEDRFALILRAINRRFNQNLEGLAVILCDRDYNRIARTLSRKKVTDCWYIVNASLRSARWLSGPTVSVFADFMFLSCPSNVPARALRRLKTDVNRVLNKVDQIICLSDHVKHDHLPVIAGNRAVEKVNVIRVAHVSILEDAPYVEMVGNMPIKTPASLAAARKIVTDYVAAQAAKDRLREVFRLRGYLPDRHLILQYLLDLANTDAPFVFCSTQNRAYKNVALVVKSVAELRKSEVPGLRLVMTGQVDYNSTGMPELITKLGAVYDFISLPRVPRPVHAAIYHLASVTVHPSFHEGGTGAFPLWESTSVGTPAVLSRNASSLEDPDLRDKMDEFMFDPYSIDEASEVILKALREPARVLQCQRDIISEKDARGETWQTVGLRYKEVFEKTIAIHAQGRTARR